MFDLPQIVIPATVFETTLAVLIFLALWQAVKVGGSLFSLLRRSRWAPGNRSGR